DVGPRDSLEFLAQTLRTALNLGLDPLGLSQYPPPPARTRVKYLHHALGVRFIAPPRWPWLWSTAAGLVVTALLLLLSHYADPGPHFLEIRPDFSALSLLLCSIIGVIAAIVAGTQMSRLLCWTTVGVSGKTLLLIETGLLRPCNIRIPLENLDRI